MSSDAPADNPFSFEDFLSGKRETPGEGQAAAPVAPPAPEADPAQKRILANIRAALTHQLRSEALTVLPAGMTVQASGNVGKFAYCPDVIVDTDIPVPEATEAKQPQVIFEVAAAGSERADFIEKWQIHRSLPTLNVYGLVDSAAVAVTLQSRTGDTWKTETFADLDDQLFLPAIHCLLPLETIYEGVFSQDEEESQAGWAKL